MPLMTLRAPGASADATALPLRRPWLAHGIGWMIGGVVYYLAVLPFMENATVFLLAQKLIWALDGWALSSAMGWFYRRVELAGRGLPGILGISLGASGVMALVWVMSMGGLAWVTMGTTEPIFAGPFLPFVVSNHVFILLAWTGGYLALVYWNRSQMEGRKSLAALGHAREAQLEMLRYQLNPHFLFNALASLRALISEDPQRARETVSRLSDFLRYTLGVRDSLSGSLADEVEVVRAYLDIERVRFEERLEVSFDEDPGVAEALVPTFLLHGLVENAVKHGRPVEGRLRIHIVTRGDADGLTLTVSNTGVLEETPTSNGGIGLANVRARLAAAYPSGHGFVLEQYGAWVRAVVRIPVREG